MYMGNASVIHSFQENVTVGAVGAAASVEVAVTVPGAAVGDLVLFAPRQANTGPVAFGGGRVSAANTVQLRFTNGSAAGSTPPATDDYDVYVIQARGAIDT